MQNTLIAFSGAQYHDTTKRIVEDSVKFGATQVKIYDDFWLRNKRPQMWLDMKHLWSRPDARGISWFSWKPATILDALNRCGPDDAIFYVDADTYPIHDLKVVFDTTRRDGHMVFNCIAQPHKYWCTRACFQEMGIPTDTNGVPIDRARYYDTLHACARFMGFMPTDENRHFLNEWYRYCLNIDCTTFQISNPEKYGPEQPELKQHRTEQAIFTNLVLQKGWKLWREACQFGEPWPEDRDAYPQLFFQNGQHTFAPGFEWGNYTAGSSFRNVND